MATSQYREAESNVANLRQKLLLLGMSAQRIDSLNSSSQISSEVTVPSPSSGTVTSRTVNSGEACPRCDNGTLEVFKAMEIGHIFKLGTKYSESMGANVLTADGKSVPIIMGSYGIGVERIITAAIEQNHDADGIIWPKSITPFDVIITITNIKDEKLRDAGDKLYKDLQAAGLEVLLDDRDERAGVKFKDADLIGIPYRITVGKKIADEKVELLDRKAKQSEDVGLAEVVSRVQTLALSGQ